MRCLGRQAPGPGPAPASRAQLPDSESARGGDLPPPIVTPPPLSGPLPPPSDQQPLEDRKPARATSVSPAPGMQVVPNKCLWPLLAQPFCRGLGNATRFRWEACAPERWASLLRRAGGPGRGTGKCFMCPRPPQRAPAQPSPLSGFQMLTWSGLPSPPAPQHRAEPFERG